MNDFVVPFTPRQTPRSTADRAVHPKMVSTSASPVILTLRRLLVHLDLTPTLVLMARIEVRGSGRRPQVRGKGISVPDVLRAARRCTTLEEVLELRPGLDELDVRACLAYTQKVRGQRAG